MRRTILILIASFAFAALTIGFTGQASGDLRFANLHFNDSTNAVTLKLPTNPCDSQGDCTWALFVDEPFVPGKPVIAIQETTRGDLTVAYPSFCGVLQADAVRIVGGQIHKEVGFRHVIHTCAACMG